MVSSSSPLSRVLMAAAATALLSASTVHAVSEVIGQDLCSCTPHVYEFTLDFELSCQQMVTDDGNEGVGGHSCAVAPFGEENRAKEDMIPDLVHSITFTELDRNLDVLIEETRENMALQHGDVFSYESFSNNPEDIEGVADLPRALQLNVAGVNQHGEDVTNVVVITFSNDCEFFPVVQPEDTLGWMRVKSVVDPIPQLCPAVAAVLSENQQEQPRESRHHYGSYNNNPASAPTRYEHKVEV